jgi:hypothetical protein
VSHRVAVPDHHLARIGASIDQDAKLGDPLPGRVSR